MLPMQHKIPKILRTFTQNLPKKCLERIVFPDIFVILLKSA